MLVLAKRNIIIPCEGGVTTLHRDVVEDVPEAITKSTYFQGLVRDGKIVIPQARKTKTCRRLLKNCQNTQSENRGLRGDCGMIYWGKPQFYGVKGAAANIGHSTGDYTVAQFQIDFPQFFNSEGEPLLPEDHAAGDHKHGKQAASRRINGDLVGATP